MPSYISSIGTATPGNPINQNTIADFMEAHLSLSDRERKLMRLLYRASGIQQRYSVIEDFGKPSEDFKFFPNNESLEPFPSVSKRMAVYEQKAVQLCVEAVKKCLVSYDSVSPTHLITVSCTGMYAPGIDIELVERLNFPTDIQRTSINFMGCYASFNALKVAVEISKNDPKACILIVAVELCSIHFLKNTEEDGLLSNALFGDGAAAVLVTGSKTTEKQLQIEQFYSDLALEGKKEMSWHISDFGFQMRLSGKVPEVIRRGIRKLTSKLLGNLKMSVKDIDHFAIHPGGKRILEVIEEELNLTKEQNAPAYKVLKNYGNMSSPTVLFVLEEIINSSNRGESILSFAFGPGLTMESMLLKIT